MSFKNIQHLIIGTALLLSLDAAAQHKSYLLSAKGDTINVVDIKNSKQGKWVISVAELRGEPGFEEEGYFKNDKKSGPWRKYNATGDIIAVENYKAGGKEGVQEYFTFLGDIEKHEEWRGYNPETPFDTIAVYGQGNNEIKSYKIVKAEPYSVPNGEWKYYAPGGIVTKIERYDRGQLLKNVAEKPVVTSTAALDDEKPKEKIKTKEILEYEKKYSKKKRKQMERDGQTGL